MARLRETLLPRTELPQEAACIDPTSTLGRVLQSAWLGNSIGGIDLIRGIRAVPPSTVSVLPRQAGLALVGSGTVGTVAAVPALSFPYVQAAYGVFTSSAGNWVLSGFNGSVGGYQSDIVLGSSTTVTFNVRYNFGTARTLTVTLPTSVNVPIAAVMVAYSATDYRLFVNGQQANGTLSPGTLGTGLDRVFPPGGTLTGALYFTGFGSGNSITDEEALAITGDPARFAQLFEPVRVWVPVTAAAGVTVNVPAASASVSPLAPTVSTPNAIAMPVASATVSALAPSVSTPQAVAVPAALLTASPLAPTVTVGAGQFIAVPAATVTFSALAPSVTGAAGVSVAVPAASIGATAYVPSVFAGSAAAISVPAGSLTLTARAPTVQTRTPDPLRFDISTGRLVKVISAAVVISF